MHMIFLSFFFIVPATTEIYTLSLHDALPICIPDRLEHGQCHPSSARQSKGYDRNSVGSAIHFDCRAEEGDRKSTRLNSSHVAISYAVFCLKKKKNKKDTTEYIRQIQLCARHS